MIIGYTQNYYFHLRMFETKWLLVINIADGLQVTTRTTRIEKRLRTFVSDEGLKEISILVY